MKILGWSAALLLGSMLATGSGRAVAAELIVFSSKDCAITQQFRREVTEDYKGTKGDQTFPLRFVDINKAAIRIILSQPATISPTFVLVDSGKEIARFVGYPGREPFLRLMDDVADVFQKQKSAH
jgi:thioredoxin-related protein